MLARMSKDLFYSYFASLLPPCRPTPTPTPCLCAMRPPRLHCTLGTTSTAWWVAALRCARDLFPVGGGERIGKQVNQSTVRWSHLQEIRAENESCPNPPPFISLCKHLRTRIRQVTNLLFRMGASATLLSNKKSERKRAKYELTVAHRVHLGKSEEAFR